MEGSPEHPSNLMPSGGLPPSCPCLSPDRAHLWAEETLGLARGLLGALASSAGGGPPLSLPAVSLPPPSHVMDCPEEEAECLQTKSPFIVLGWATGVTSR